jgi:cell division protease FtsH
MERKEALERIAAALLEYETLDAPDIDVLMSGGAISRPPPSKPMATTLHEKPKDAPAASGAAPVTPVQPTPGPAREGA